VTRRRLTALIAAATAVAILVPAAPAGAGPTAQKSGEELLTIVTTGKIKVKKKISVRVACGAPNCVVSGQLEIKVKGPNAVLPYPPIALVNGQTADAEFTLSKGARKAIVAQIRSAKLGAEFTAQNSLTGEIDVDTKTFKFKR
jgi:hypothetical protein